MLPPTVMKYTVLSRLGDVYRKRFVQLFANEISMRGHLTQEW